MVKTSTAIILVGVAGVGIYFLTRPKAGRAVTPSKAGKGSTAQTPVNVNNVLNAATSLLGVIFHPNNYVGTNGNDLYPSNVTMTDAAAASAGYEDYIPVNNSVYDALSLNGLFGGSDLAGDVG